jgi:DNA invertase Pin-like site-specific DNA recombinase
MLDQLRSGDTLVVWKLDRLSRSLKDLLTLRNPLIFFHGLTRARF